ncbi:sigma-54-dependent Fis family transcriptional regulator [Marinobacter apostichopi]|uniref:sigma-54-dependent Fis family transcriptional regulator n=1 Tax=Marinobacter apostichopi TaxID=3035454 RepID=UPI00257415F2|nr:sigma-54-dependent Fis family transcriptional regulator [Marinobacter sp. LA51]
MRKNERAKERQLVIDSWNRCLASGLSHDDKAVARSADPAYLDEVERRHEKLMASTAAEVVPYYQNVLSSSRCLILMADPDANILKSWGDERVTDVRLRSWLQRGANWQETLCGTNAIGTAIATQLPVQVQRNEHFLKQFRSLIGSAAPIFDAEKQLAGVLSVFSDAYLPQAHTLGMVRLLSQSVENRLIIRQFEASHFQITLNTTADNFDSPWSGILVCDSAGKIVASNQRADQLLATDTVQRHLDDLFTSSRQHILGHPEHTAIQLVTKGKVRLSARLKRPSTPAQANDYTTAPTGSRADPGSRDSTKHQDLFNLEYGDSSVRRCAVQALKVLQRGVPVLITGETGVGKEVLVKALHQSSPRSNSPLVAVNCAAIPPELVESELFGYESGAFTGARAQGSLGLIRKANKGILFLDEIGEMPLAAQSRLLRVLQERVVTPVGSTESVPVDILLITATNRPLSSRIDAGQFRADLFYRINGLSVQLPPLRQRTDKRELIQDIYRQHRDPGQREELPPQVLSALENHPWPGNIRQLVNVLRVAIAIADGEEVDIWHLPEDFLAEYDTASPTRQSRPDRADQAGASSFEQIHETSTDPLTRTLQVYRDCTGNVSETARQLSISRNTLYKRLRELGIR